MLLDFGVVYEYFDGFEFCFDFVEYLVDGGVICYVEFLLEDFGGVVGCCEFWDLVGCDDLVVVCGEVLFDFLVDVG